jgi:hypothetical protein
MIAMKRMALAAILFGGLALTAAPSADAGIFVRRVAPVRRVAARVALPPYPVARRAAFGPVYRPYYRPYVGPAFYGRGYYGPGVSVGIGLY